LSTILKKVNSGTASGARLLVEFEQPKNINTGKTNIIRERNIRSDFINNNNYKN